MTPTKVGARRGDFSPPAFLDRDFRESAGACRRVSQMAEGANARMR